MNEGNEGLKRCLNPTYMIKRLDLTSPEKAARARRRSSCQTSQAQPSLCTLVSVEKITKEAFFLSHPEATPQEPHSERLGCSLLGPGGCCVGGICMCGSR